MLFTLEALRTNLPVTSKILTFEVLDNSMLLALTLIEETATTDLTFTPALQRFTSYKFVDHDNSINTILNCIADLDGKTYNEISDLIITIKNIFSGANVEWEKFEMTILTVGEFLKTNNKDRYWIDSIEKMIKKSD